MNKHTSVSRRSLLRSGATAAAALPLLGLDSPSGIEAQTQPFISSPDAPATPATTAGEPNVEKAALWFPDQRNIWTPVGWKDHYFRFNIVYNGTILAEPAPHWTPPRPNARQWLGQSFQLDFIPSKDGAVPPLPKEKTQLWRTDSGIGLQGWREDHQTPVLWTEWRLQEGLVIRQEVFSHIKGGADVVTAIEPHFAWVRLVVTHVDELRAAEKTNIAVRLSQIYYNHNSRYKDEDGVTIDLDPQLAPYSKQLRAEEFTGGGMRVIEPDGKVRLVALPSATGKAVFSSSSSEKGIYALKVELDGKVGAYVDLLLPMLAEGREVVDDELSAGRERALREGDAYWSRRPTTAARFHVPEDYINGVVERGLNFAELIAEKDYKTGDYTFLTGSWGYDNLWSTPTSMTSHMFMDLLGYHETVDRHTELFKKYQGTVKPPGPTYELHPGYLSTPRTLTAFDWMSDHGAILHQVSTHALLTGDQSFIEKWTEPILKACDFIRDACAQTNHDGVKGLLPPAVATDEIIPLQAVWNMAWHYKGLISAVRLLKRISHQRSAEFERFASDFKSTFDKAFRERMAAMPKWTDSKGNKRLQPPTTLSFKPRPYHPFNEITTLDSGAMVLVWGGLMEAHDELMRTSVEYFREGPNWKLYGKRSNPLARPVLIHEISSGEPCYSWNVFHSWQLGDSERFLEGMYSLFVGAISPQTYITGEHRHGVYGNIFVLPLAFTLARLAVIDDEIAVGELHLLRLCPQAWVSAKGEAVFERMPTIYGTINLRFKKSADGKTLDITFNGKWRERPNKVVLHVSPAHHLSRVAVNGILQPRAKSIELKSY